MILDFEPIHLHLIDVQDTQKADFQQVIKSCSSDINIKDKTFTYVKDGEILAIYGIYPLDLTDQPHRCVAWSVFSRNMKYGCNYIGIIKSLVKMLKVSHNAGYNRIEAVIRPEHQQAIDFIELLGFNKEGMMTSFFSKESDAYLYAKINQ